jgi:hypothetical protein
VEIRFGFLTSDGRFDATIPDGFLPHPDLVSSVVFDGKAHSIYFSRTNQLIGTDFVYMREVTVANRTCSLYSRTNEPEMLALMWAVGGGFLWTQFEPGVSPSDQIEVLATGMNVFTDIDGFPQVRFSNGLFPGNVREPMERDVAFFNSDTPDGRPSTISFSLAAGLSTDNVQRTGVAVVASRGTAAGVTVACVGGAGQDRQVEALAATVGGSLRAG